MKLNKKSRTRAIKKLAESAKVQDILEKTYAKLDSQNTGESFDVNNADSPGQDKFLDALTESVIDSVYSDIPEL